MVWLIQYDGGTGMGPVGPGGMVERGKDLKDPGAGSDMPEHEHFYIPGEGR